MEPQVIVLPRVRVKAWQGTFPLQVPTFQARGLEEALQSTYKSDACILQYGPPRNAGESPRLGIGASAYYQMNEKICPDITTILVDIDHENHTPPPDSWHLDIIAKIPDTIGCGWYRTPNGLRLVFLPMKPVPITRGNNFLHWFHEVVLASWGIESDPATRTWYRLFKAPRAMGRDLPTDVTDLRPLPMHPRTIPMDDAASFGLISSYDQIPEVKTPPVKLLRAWIGDEHLVQKLRYGQALAAPGERHQALLTTAIKLAHAMRTRDPADVYSCIHKCAEAQGTPVGEAWQVCEWAASIVAGQLEEEERGRQTVFEAYRDAMGGDMRRVIISIGSRAYVWNEHYTSYMGPFAITGDKALTVLLRDHCSTLVPPSTPIKEVLQHHRTIAQKISYSYISDKFSYAEDTQTFTVPAARVDKDLEPKYHEDIDEWLEMIGGDKLRDWLASFARLDKPACALYIHGKAGIGKGLLTQGIARVFSSESRFTAYQTLFMQFQRSLLTSPLVVADEKVPSDVFNQNESSIFREILTNPVREVNIKHQAPIGLRGYVRILITANNENALQIRESLTPEDVEAVQQRIGYLRVGDNAIDFLESRADLDYWAQKKIPEHILYLMTTRVSQDQTAGRYIVPGWPSELTERMSTSHGSVTEVIDIIATAIRDDILQDAVRWFGGKIYVYAPDLAKSWLLIQGQDIDRPPTKRARLDALRTLSLGEKIQLRRTEKAGRRMRQYWVIDPHIIARHAERQNIALAHEILEAVSREGDRHTLIAPVEKLI